MATIRSKSGVKAVVSGSVFLAAVSFCTAAFASDGLVSSGQGQMMQIIQQKDQVTIPKEKKELPPIKIETEKPAKAQVQGSKTVLVKRFDIQGNTLLKPEVLKAVVAPVEGKELSMEDIKNVAELITAQYREAGYLIANAYVPTQSVVDGVVIIFVVEGKLGDISVTGNKSYSTPFIKRYLNTARNDVSLRDDTLERALLLLGDYPSLSVKAALKSGKKEGTTDLLVDVADKFPISGSLSFDNFGEKTTSKTRLVGTLDLGNLLFSGDMLMLRGLMGLDRIDVNRLSYGRAEYMVPVGGYGTQIGMYYANSLYKAGEELAELELNGKATVCGIYATHPFIKKRDEALNVRLGGEYIDSDINMFGGKWTTDKIRTAILNVSYTMTDRYLGRNFIGFGYSRGLGSILNGTHDDDPNASRIDSDNNFNKFTLDAMRIQKLPGYNYFILRAAGQYSSDRLFVAEQFLLGGEGTVRGFSPAQISGDSGYSVSGELVTSPLFPEKTIFKQKVGDTIKFALFADYGGVYINNADSSEKHFDSLTSVGAGVRLFAGKYFSAKLDWAQPVSGHIAVNRSYIYVQAGLSF